MTRPRVGDVLGAWTTLERIAGSKHKHPQWVCRCACGTVKTLDEEGLASGRSRSCGCVKYPCATKTHGMNTDPIMGVWRNMVSRCTKPSHRCYKHYGGRGISVHPSWLSFERFNADCGPHPGGGLTFDRIDNEGNYEPGNVRWATRAVQARNTRSNTVVEYEGREMCVQDWAHELGVTANHLYRRGRKGMSWQQAIADIVENPPKKKGPYRKTAP